MRRVYYPVLINVESLEKLKSIINLCSGNGWQVPGNSRNGEHPFETTFSIVVKTDEGKTTK